MADGLSVAAGAAGLISLGLEVTKGLIDYYDAYKSRESNIVEYCPHHQET